MPQPQIIRQFCPACKSRLVEVTYREGADNAPARCLECDNWVHVEKKPNGTLDLAAQPNPNRLDTSIKECPNPKCKNPLRTWRAQNGAIAVMHGAKQFAQMTFICEKCEKQILVT